MKLADLRKLGLRRHARRFALRTQAVAYRTIVVPLLEQEETAHALDLACRLAADRRAQIVLVAPAVLERELPLNAHLDGALTELKTRFESATAVASSYGVGVRRQIVRTRPGCVGEAVAQVAAERRAELVVVGAPVESRRGFRRAFPRDVLLLARDAPCRVMIATGPFVAARRNTVTPWHDGVRPSSSSASWERTHSSPPRTATLARRSTTPSA
jgi:nucleotide-binding universal stress UspA family protein